LATAKKDYFTFPIPALRYQTPASNYQKPASSNQKIPWTVGSSAEPGPLFDLPKKIIEK